MSIPRRTTRFWRRWRAAGRSKAAVDRRRRWTCESLEPRQALDAAGVLWGSSANVTLSFAQDGTLVADEPSALFALFDSVAPRAEWQAAVLNGFRAWTPYANADFGVVVDSGADFGAPGASHGDRAVGDVRIGAVSLPADVFAVSVPHDRVVAGTWGADVVFNSAATFHSVADVFGVALHEAGHVLGLSHNPDPNSPMHAHGVPMFITPTAEDIAALQALYGARAPDLNETDQPSGNIANNDSSTRATELDRNHLPGESNGTAPSIVYGDIAAPNDIDWFQIDEVSSYNGTVSFTVRTAGISLLAPRLEVYSESLQWLGASSSASVSGDSITVTVPGSVSGSGWWLRVSAAAEDTVGVGGYSLTAIWDNRLAVPRAEVEAAAGGALRFLPQNEIRKLFNEPNHDLYYEDAQADDNPVNALPLETAPGFVEDTRYEVVGSLSGPSDVDHYLVKSPRNIPAGADTMLVAVRLLESGRLVPRVRVFDDQGTELPVEVLVNGLGDLVVQVHSIVDRDDYTLRIESADAEGLFTSGNYRLTATFGRPQAPATTFAQGQLGPALAAAAHGLYVGQTQLFQLGIAATADDPAASFALRALVFDEQDRLVHQQAAGPGQMQTGASFVLRPGAYTLRVQAVSPAGTSLPTISYDISGLTISEPIGPDPIDTTGDPLYTCPDNSGEYCYPGGIRTPNPFHWSNTSPGQGSIPSLNPFEVLTLVLGNWWSWYWNEGSSGLPTAQADQYRAAAGQSLQVPVGGGLLQNDLASEGDVLAAFLQNAPSHGQLSLSFSGSFVYQPEPGFVGIDHFTYAASDLRSFSDVTTVTIEVALPGDANGDLRVDGDDYLAWIAHQGQASGATLSDGDFSGDGQVTAADYVLWADNFGANLVPNPPGDANGDQLVDSVDYEIWRNHWGDVPATIATGDFNGDGLVSAADYTVWADNLTIPLAAVAPLPSTPAAAPLAFTAELTVGASAPAEPSQQFEGLVMRRTSSDRLAECSAFASDLAWRRAIEEFYPAELKHAAANRHPERDVD